MTLDATVYGAYAQTISFDIEGAAVAWKDIPPIEQDKVIPLIERQADALKKDYHVDLSVSADRTYVSLKIRHRGRATEGQVLDLKGRVFAVIVVTSWGGPG